MQRQLDRRGDIVQNLITIQGLKLAGSVHNVRLGIQKLRPDI